MSILSINPSSSAAKAAQEKYKKYKIIVLPYVFSRRGLLDVL